MIVGQWKVEKSFGGFGNKWRQSTGRWPPSSSPVETHWALESWWALSGCFCAFDNALYQAFDLTSIPNQRSKILLTVPRNCECIGSGGQRVGKSVYESLINSQGPFTPFDLSYSNAIWRHSLLHRSLKIRLGGRFLREFDGAEIGCEMRGVGNSIDL